MKINGLLTRVLLVVFLSFLMTSAALSQDQAPPANFSKTELHFLFNMGPLVLNKVDEAGRTLTFTLDHFSTWRFGSNYFFIDTTGGPDYDFYSTGYSLYLEYSPNLSMNKIFDFSFGNDSILREISLNGQINLGAAGSYEINRAWLEGVMIDWHFPGCTVLSTYFLAKQEEAYKPSWQFTLVWNIPFKIASTGFEFNGFMDIWQRFKKDSGTEDALVLLSQPQILCNLDFFKLKDFFIGIEFGISHAFPSEAMYAGKDSSWDIMISPMILFRF